MCGIVGVYNKSGNYLEKSGLKKMADAMTHRGPDGEGYFVNNTIALAHKRLSIIDLSEHGAQPMQSADQNVVISYNGEVYNFPKLKKELINKGYSFTSKTDTEVLIYAYLEWGIDFVQKLNGMFAFSLWDKRYNKMFLVRDRYGIKPLYYWINNATEIVFASEIKAIIKHQQFKTELNYSALNEYFTFQNVFRYHTLFKGVHMLPPGSVMTIEQGTTENKIKNYWDFDFFSIDNKITEQEAIDETLRLFDQAVKRQMISDVKVGSYLSGGMDSGSITAIAASNYKRLTTFTCGFDMSAITGREANFDERRDAEIMSSYFKTEHYEMVINAGDISWSMPRLVYHLEDLRVGMSYPNYYISRLASKFVKVCLSGTGGDELYGGYPWRYYRIFKSLNQQEFFKEYYSFWQRLVTDDEKLDLFTPKVTRELNESRSPFEIFSRVFTFNNKLTYNTPEDHISNSLYFEAKTFLPALFLVGDKLSMANSLEERFPFMDNDLVNFAQKIPIKYKLANLEMMKKMDENEANKLRKFQMQFDDGKNVLRKAMANLIPAQILNRQKQGFSAPDESWYRGENLEYVKKILLDKDAVCTEYINADFIKKTIHEHVNLGINHRLLIWSLISFEWWCKLFLKGYTLEEN
jgi:asparagine synthase (glutamine-hydrolysing)